MSDAAKDMLVFGLYHPKMALPSSAKGGANYTAKTKNERNRLLFERPTVCVIIAEAIKSGG